MSSSFKNTNRSETEKSRHSVKTNKNSIHKQRKKNAEDIEEANDYNEYNMKDPENLDGINLSRNGIITTDSDEYDFFEDEGMLSAVELLHENTSYFMFSPNSSSKLGWDLIGFAIIIYQSVVSPYRLWFDVDAAGFFFVLETIMDIFFISDFILNFNTGIYEKGMLIMKRSTVVYIYLKSWFLIDLLAWFPFEYTIEFFFVSDPNSNANQYSKAPRLLRMLKLIRFFENSKTTKSTKA